MISQQVWQAYEQDSAAFTLTKNVDKDPRKVTFKIINIDCRLYWALAELDYCPSKDAVSWPSHAQIESGFNPLWSHICSKIVVAALKSLNQNLTVGRIC